MEDETWVTQHDHSLNLRNPSLRTGQPFWVVLGYLDLSATKLYINFYEVGPEVCLCTEYNTI